MSKQDNSEVKDRIRQSILQVDTVYKFSKNHTTEFLPPNYYIDRLVDATFNLLQKEVEKAKDWWNKDITKLFTPNCIKCGKPATEQTSKGKYAQENNHRP